MDRLKNNGKSSLPGGFAPSGLSTTGNNTIISPPEDQMEIPTSPELDGKKEEIQQELKKSRAEREEKDNSVADQLIVIHGAKVKFNSHLGEFKVLSDVPTTQDKLTGTIVEKNIPNFTFYDGFILNTLTMWQDFGTMKVQENEVLIKKSFNPGIGLMPGSSVPEPGKIEFINSGQIHMPESIETEGAPLPEQVEKKEDFKD